MPNFITSVPGIGGATAAVLSKHGFRTIEDLTEADSAALAAVPGFGEKRAERIIEAARVFLDADRSGSKSESKAVSEPEPVAVVEDASQVDPDAAEETKGKKSKKSKKEKKGKGKKTKKDDKGKKHKKPGKKNKDKSKKAK